MERQGELTMNAQDAVARLIAEANAAAQQERAAQIAAAVKYLLGL